MEYIFLSSRAPTFSLPHHNLTPQKNKMRPLGILAFLFAAVTNCLPISLPTGNSTIICARDPGHCTRPSYPTSPANTLNTGSSKPSIPSVADLYTVLNTKHLAPIQPPPCTGPIFSVTDWAQNKLGKAVQVLCPHAPHAPHVPHVPHGQGLGNGRDQASTPVGFVSKTKGLMSGMFFYFRFFFFSCRGC